MEVAEKKVKVLIADDHEIFLLGLAYLLKQNQIFELVGKILEPNEILTMVELKKPDLLIIDFLMPGTNGLDIIVKAKSKIPNLKTIIISNISDEKVIQLCKDSGIDGFVAKYEPKDILLNAIETVIKGGTYFTKKIGNMPDFEKIRNSKMNPFHRLSPKELEFISYFTNGLTYTEIAEKMDISDRTVNTHRVNVTRKLGKLTLGELINLAKTWGIAIN